MVSHHHKCIFVHVPKAGGQSIETFFLNDLGLTWKNRRPLLLMPNSEPDVGPPFLGHLTAQEYTEHHYISQELFDSYFVFSCVRNPWSRAVSFYKYLGYHNTHTFRQFVEDILPGELFDSKFYFVRPQVDYITDSQGHIIVNYVAKLETLDQDFEVVRESLNVDGPLPHVNSAKPQGIRPGRHPRSIVRYLRHRYLVAQDKLPTHKSYAAYYSHDLVERIADIYRRDVEAFDYSFDA